MNKNNIRLVVTDMDKTLLNDEGIISNGNIAAIRELKKSGIKFAIASGRGKEALLGFLERYGISENVDYIIGMNGVSLYDSEKDESMDFGYIDENILTRIYNSLSSLDISFAVHRGKHLICSRRTQYTDIECYSNNYEYLDAPDFLGTAKGKYPKIMLIAEGKVLDGIHDHLAEMAAGDFNFFRCYEYFTEIVKIGVSKGEALKRLCELKGIDIRNVMAIGDNLNDLDMIKASGFGVAVENACEAVKKEALFISKSNNEDGFAWACENILKGLK